MARRQFQYPRNSGSRPNRSWAGAIPAVAVNVPAASKVLLASITLSNQGIDETILRVVGTVFMNTDQVAASESQHGAVGMCIVTDTALAVGIASLPDPVTDVQDDIWFMFQTVVGTFHFGTAVGFNANGGTNYPVDSKVKRILSSGHSVAVIAANASATTGFQITFPVRVLTQVRGTR